MNKEAQHFYDCWDLMTLTVIVGLLSLLEEIMIQQSICMEDMTEANFLQLVDEIFNRISLLGRWTDDPSWGSQDFSSDEVLMFSLGQCCSQFLTIMILLTQISFGMGSGCWLRSRPQILAMEKPSFPSSEIPLESTTCRERLATV